jgi:hypothetical protein
MKNSNYDLVLEIVKSYEAEDILDDFKSEFEEGSDISKSEFVEFFNRYIDDMSEVYFIGLNWKYVDSGGDEGVYDEML